MIVHNNRIFMNTFDSLHISDDNGVTWQSKKIEGAVGLSHFESFKNILLLKDCFRNVFMSRDNGATWITFNSGLPPNFYKVNLAAAHLVDSNNVYIVYNDAGIFKRAINDFLSSTSAISNVSNIVIAPNPTSGDFYFSLPENESCNNSIQKITIVNSVGETVLTRLEQCQKQMNLNISHLPNGLYFLQTQIGYHSYIGKILIQK